MKKVTFVEVVNINKDMFEREVLSFTAEGYESISDKKYGISRYTYTTCSGIEIEFSYFWNNRGMIGVCQSLWNSNTHDYEFYHHEYYNDSNKKKYFLREEDI